MADKSIGARIELKGEKEYSAAIKEAQRNLRVLRSELKAESAELGKNASEQDKNAAKAKSLKAQIAEQEKIVETMRAAMEAARREYGENSEAVAGWEIRLNNARATLGSMRSDLESASGGIADVGASFVEAADGAEMGVVAAKSFADALTDVGNVFGSVSDGIEQGFIGIVGHVKEAVAAIWGELMEVSARANEWTDLGAMFGTSAGNIQKWYHSVNAEAKDFTQLVNFANKILTGDQTKIAEATQVDLSGYTDQWEGFIAVMNSLSKMDKQGQMDALAHMGITGPKEAGWLDMLGAWEDVVDNLGRFDAENGGVGMTDKQIEDMNQLSLSVASIEETWRAFKDSWAAGLGPLALDLTSNVQGALDALIRFMNAEDQKERDQALADFKQNLTDFFTKLGEAITEAANAMDEVGTELQTSEDGMVRTIGNVLKNLSELLRWFQNENNIETVKRGVGALAAVWLTGKGAQMVSTVAGFAKNLGIITGIGGGASGAAGAAGGTAGAAGGAAGGVGIMAGIKAMVSATLPVVLAEASVIAAAVTPAVLAQMKDENKWKAEQERQLEAANRIEESGDKATADFIRRGALASGPKRNADGSYDRDWTGLFLNMNPTDDLTNLTAGLKNRSDQQKAELYNMLMAYAPETAGMNTWNLLQRKWTANDLSGTEETELLQSVMKAMVLWSENSGARDAARERDAEARRAWWAQNESEDVDLSEYTREQAEEAIQDWWDAWRNADQNPTAENQAEEESAFAWMQEVLGEGWGDVYDQLIQKLDEERNPGRLEDIPQGWYSTMLDTMGLEQQTSGELKKSIDGLAKTDMEGAAARGVRDGLHDFHEPRDEPVEAAVLRDGRLERRDAGLLPERAEVLLRGGGVHLARDDEPRALAGDRLDAVQRLGRAVREVVEDRDRMARGVGRDAGVAADVAGAAGDEDVHFSDE